MATVHEFGGSSSSSSSSASTSDAAPAFPQFSSLPPELRAQIWRAAVPTPGINFFNTHSFPGDHPGANRSTSPPWLYLDVRRLDVADADADAAAYDPSAWQARYAVRQACREARDVCALPDEKRAAVTLTRPRRGLFVRAGDDQLRRLTPLNSSTSPADGGVDGDAAAAVAVEPKVTRTIQVHADDVLCLSLENCSFSMPCEENFQDQTPLGAALSSARDRDDHDLGWSYDPQLTPLPAGVPRNRYCVELARGGVDALQVISEVVPGMLHEVLDDSDDDDNDGGDDNAGDVDQARSENTTADHPDPASGSAPSGRLPPGREGGLIMLDAHVQEIGSRSLAELTPCLEVYYDRFGDAYVPLPFANAAGLRGPFGCPRFRLAKVWPERSNVRVRYLESAQLRSPKRPL